METVPSKHAVSTVDALMTPNVACFSSDEHLRVRSVITRSCYGTMTLWMKSLENAVSGKGNLRTDRSCTLERTSAWQFVGDL